MVFVLTSRPKGGEPCVIEHAAGYIEQRPEGSLVFNIRKFPTYQLAEAELLRQYPNSRRAVKADKDGGLDYYRGTYWVGKIGRAGN